jgi:hypothetical protein
MKERLKIVVPYSIAIVALVALVLFIFHKRVRIDAFTCSCIKPGMTQRQVESILGGPPGEYNSGQREIVIGLAGHNRYSDGSRVEDWGGEDGVIQVTFDAQGRVRWADFVSDELNPRPLPPARKPTALEQWLGVSLW